MAVRVMNVVSHIINLARVYQWKWLNFHSATSSFILIRQHLLGGLCEFSPWNLHGDTQCGFFFIYSLIPSGWFYRLRWGRRVGTILLSRIMLLPMMKGSDHIQMMPEKAIEQHQAIQNLWTIPFTCIFIIIFSPCF